MITIDGQQGEGGGQILRSSLSLSLITGKAFHIHNIRAGRNKPGLMRQHLTAVRAVAEISGGVVEGADIGSMELIFRPGVIKPGEYKFSIGTAGSTMLVLQTVMLPLLLADGPSEVVLEGGTHNIAAPPFDFLNVAFLPLLQRMGADVKVTLEKYGFYPAGGGRIVARILPWKVFRPLELLERGKLMSRQAIALIANLPPNIMMRELETIQGFLGLADDDLLPQEIKGAHGPGNTVAVQMNFEHVSEFFTGFGELNVRAETVATRVAKDARSYHASLAAVGPHLADQLLLPMAVVGQGAFVASRMTAHCRTNIDIIRNFLPVDIHVEKNSQNNWLVEMEKS